MSAIGKLHRSICCHDESQEWAAREGDPNTLDFNGFGDSQSILEFNA